uniref:Xanthine dehydrogenase n=1 Tax=Kryptolebias marmoratus TaxID=37003 RepID=A0A3Q3B804_KRYMA
TKPSSEFSLGLTGTKLGCAEGGCGACTVMLSRYHPGTKQLLHHAVNACLAPLCSLHMAAVTTVEGIGSVARKVHPIQERIAKCHGSQCGFCTPGMVMSMYALLRNNPTPKMADVEEAFQGNLCRCTGYRPILQGYKTFSAVTNFEYLKRLLHEEWERSTFKALCEQEATSLFNMEDFAPYDPTQEVIFPPELMSCKSEYHQSGSLCFHGERATWLQPTSLKEFLLLKWKHPEARVVVGNTEVGLSLKNMVHPLILAPAFIPELSAVTHSEDGVVFSAACTLSHVAAELRKAVRTLPPHQTEVFLAILEQLRWFAGLQIRNVAVSQRLSGSRHPISDLNPVFMAAGCKLTLMDKASVQHLSMLFPQSQFVSAFKQSPRREDDISIVTTAMSVTFTPGTDVVEDLKLSYGGMAPITVLAKKTANKLLGRRWGEELLQEACSSLAEEMTLDPSAPGGMVTYRRTLTLSLFYKFYLTVLQKLRLQVCVPPVPLNPTVPPDPPVPPVPPDPPVPPVPPNPPTVFADGQVTCVGHIIGAVVADTQIHAQRAAKAVKIQYEELQPVITIQEAIAARSFYEPIRTIQNGDLEAGFKQAEHILEGKIHIGGQEHFYLETHVTLAVPREDDEMELFVSTQAFVAKALGVSANKVLIRVKRLGGGFGGKESRTIVLSPVVALAANKLKRPVRCMLDRDEDMLITGGRHPFYGKYKVGFLNSGKVVALDVSFYSNAGNSLDLSQAVSIMERALFHMENSYRVPNIRGQGFMCRTNLPTNTAFRGFGGPQGMMVAESWITDVAHSLGRSAEEVRRFNLYLEGESTPYNQILHGLTLDRCWDECLSRSGYEQRRAAAQLYNRQNRWTKRGLAVVPTKFGISFTVNFLNQAGALVHVYRDGSVLLNHGGTEMGQGLHTKMVQVASRVLGVPCSKIHISETSTNTVINTSPTAASVSSDLNGAAVQNACEILQKRLEPFKAQNPKGSWEDWVKAAYFDRVSLSANGFYRTPDLGYDFETNSGRLFHYYSYGVACSEVEIDCLTGAHKNLSTTIVMDVGRSLNPAIDIGQVEGGFMQGLGLFTLEELQYSPQGVLLTRGPGSYKIPAFGDIPTELSVSLLRDAPNDKAIFASKAVGEPPLFLAASIFYAIKDAISAAREESGLTGPFRLDSPASTERIRNACSDRFTKLVPEPQICSICWSWSSMLFYSESFCCFWFSVLLQRQEPSGPGRSRCRGDRD